MEVKVVSSAGRSNRISKDHYHKNKSVHREFNESINRIGKVMSHLIPDGRHFADDANLLRFTVEYLKHSTDFQRGVGLCAEEAKTFLKQHIFDKRKINDLFQQIDKINFIPKPEYIEQINVKAEPLMRPNSCNSNEVETDVLLDLSTKQNRLRNVTDYSYNSTNIHRLCNNLKKREILDKIRKKIMDKRRMSHTNRKLEIEHNEIMWRPWRY